MSSSPVNVSSSSASRITRTVVTGLSPVAIDSTSLFYINLEVYSGEDNSIHIPIELSGLMNPIFPPSTPPVDFAGLSDPVAAPALTKSTGPNGRLTPGMYRYSYAAWKGSKTQATAPSPSVDITLNTENTVTLTYPAITGADGYLVYREDL